MIFFTLKIFQVFPQDPKPKPGCFVTACAHLACAPAFSQMLAAWISTSFKKMKFGIYLFKKKKKKNILVSTNFWT